MAVAKFQQLSSDRFFHRSQNNRTVPAQAFFLDFFQIVVLQFQGSHDFEPVPSGIKCPNHGIDTFFSFDCKRFDRRKYRQINPVTQIRPDTRYNNLYHRKKCHNFSGDQPVSHQRKLEVNHNIGNDQRSHLRSKDVCRFEITGFQGSHDLAQKKQDNQINCKDQ